MVIPNRLGQPRFLWLRLMWISAGTALGRVSPPYFMLLRTSCMDPEYLDEV